MYNDNIDRIFDNLQIPPSDRAIDTDSVSVPLKSLQQMKFYCDEMAEANKALFTECNRLTEECNRLKTDKQIHNTQQSSFEFSTTAKGELTLSAKVYHDNSDIALSKSQELILKAESWKQLNWMNYQSVCEELEKKIEVLTKENLTLKKELDNGKKKGN